MGKKGDRLKELEKITATKINVPPINNISDVIVITGPKDGIEKAEHEIRVTSDEQSKKASERVNVPKMYHPFIIGPHSKNLANMIAETGARIHVPPPSVMNDEIMIAGEKEAVRNAKARILAIHSEMVSNSKLKYTVGKPIWEWRNWESKKSFWKYVSNEVNTKYILLNDMILKHENIWGYFIEYSLH